MILKISSVFFSSAGLTLTSALADPMRCSLMNSMFPSIDGILSICLLISVWIPVIFRSCCKLTQFTFRFDVYCRRFQLQFIMGKLLKCKLLFHAALNAGSIANFKYKINKSSKMVLNVIKSLSWFNAQLSIHSGEVSHHRNSTSDTIVTNECCLTFVNYSYLMVTLPK